MKCRVDVGDELLVNGCSRVVVRIGEDVVYLGAERDEETSRILGQVATCLKSATELINILKCTHES